MKEFTYINKDIGLKNLNNDENLYENVLEGFLSQYNTCNLIELEDSEFFIQVHTIKGLAQTIGAMQLFDISFEINNTKQREKQTILQNKLSLVINELNNTEFKKETTNNSILKDLDEEERIKLFNSLKESALTYKPKIVEEIISKLKNYNLSQKDTQLLDKLSSHLKVYNFREIQKELEDY